MSQEEILEDIKDTLSKMEKNMDKVAKIMEENDKRPHSVRVENIVKTKPVR